MTYSSTPKLVAEIERDIRNQVAIDQMKRLGPAARFEIWFRRRSLHITLIALMFVWVTFWISVILFVNGYI